MGYIDPVGGLYVCPQVDRIPNASAVHVVAQNENGEWQINDTILCLFREPIVIIDKWDKQITNKQKMRFYIALYQDNTIAIPLKWITDKDPVYKRVEDGSV